jgi:colanic acid/amylovoran biosynthesis glycosyltransferase
MKIGYFVPEFPNQTHAFFWREAAAMEAAGDEILFLSSRRPPADACPHDFANAARARTHYVYPPRWGAAAGFLAARPGRAAAAVAYVAGLSETSVKGRARLMGLIACAADMALACRAAGVRHVHIHSCADAAHIGALANILDGISYSLTLHGDLPVYGRDHRAKMARAALVTAVTAPLARQIAEKIPGRAAPVIWMGVDMDSFSPPDAPKARGGTIHAVTIARLNLVKGHRYFLEAMARARAEGADVRYSIAGEGPYRAELEREIAVLGLQDHATLLGVVSQDRVRDLLRQADLLALTSIGQGEAAPVAVMEAMACGLPVICSRIGGTPDMIDDGINGFLVDQKDVDGIHDALMRLTREDGLADRISVAARAQAREAFDCHAKARQLHDAIAEARR